jgi:hypothetical protein
MAVSAQEPVLAWRRVSNALHSFKPSTQLVLMAFKSWLAQQGPSAPGGPDLQFSPFDSLSDAETVLITAGGTGTLYALVLKKANTATVTFSKLTDHASTSSDAASDVRIPQNVAKDEAVVIWSKGYALANGATMQGNTTANGGTSSGSDAASGFALIGT